MTGRLEQALRLKSHGFFFLVGIGSGGSRCDGSGGAQPHRGRGAQPHAWERPAGRGGDRFPGGRKRRFLGAVSLNLILQG